MGHAPAKVKGELMRLVCQLAAAVVCTAALSAGAAQQTRILHDFENENDVRLWEFKQRSASRSDQHASHGQSSLKISANEYMVSWRLPRDWSGFDSLDIDIFVEADGPVAGSLLVADVPWQQKGGTYWNRHNGAFTLKPGANTLSIPVNGLYRGEAGSRNNDIKSNIDPAQIIRLDLGFQTKEKGARGFLYLDHVRLTRETRPEGILAFDFGLESQVLFPGFAPIAWNSVYGKNGAKAGLRYAQPSGWARDSTFPTRLYQDSIGMDDNEFIADLPNGSYRVWVMYEDCGYWGGEQARFSRRFIEAEGAVAWQEDRGKDGPADYLHRFESIEPRPGASMWELYVKGLFQPKRFAVKVSDGKLNLRFKADGPQACKVAAIIVHPDSPEAHAWVADIEQRNRREFEDRAVFLGPNAKPLAPPADAQAQGWWLGFPALEDDVNFCDAPGQPDGKLARPAARGQRIALTFALRPLKDLADAPLSLTATDLKGPGLIPASALDVRYLHHSTHRGFNNIAYTIGPETLRQVAGADLRLAKDLTRQFWIVVSVPRDAAPGTYTGTLALEAGALKLTLPLAVDVQPFALDEPDFAMGFYGVHVPREVLERRGAAAWRELFQTLKAAGMNSFSGGPQIRFSGFDAAGKPLLDFAACDEFFRITRECGFDKELTSYGGPAMVQGLHEGYVIGRTGRQWEQKTGKPFSELLKIVWTAVQEHATKENWPKIQYGFTDEPRVLEQAQEQLELMKAYRQAVPFVSIGGSYSVQWDNSPLEKAIQEIFKTLVWSALNVHTQEHIDKAREFGRQLYIYNQGTSRFSFGAYQWAEMHKGIRGRMQWHLLALHGHQFFDLDGREPDTAMINWGREQIIPTLRLERCREGADDLRCAQTLWNLAARSPSRPEAQQAKAWLEQISRQISPGQNRQPAGFMDDESFRNECIRRIRTLLP